MSSVVEELQKCTPQEGTSTVTSIETSIEDDFDGGMCGIIKLSVQH